MADPWERYREVPKDIKDIPGARKTPEGYPYYGPEDAAPASAPWTKFATPPAKVESQAGPWTTFQAPQEQPKQPDQGGITSPEFGMFPFNYPSIQAPKAREAFGTMARGVEQMGTPGERLKGTANVGLGALSYTFSPIESAIESIAGRPIERATGLPKEYTDFAIGLGLPGIGFAKTPKVIQKIFSPETLSPKAMDAAALIRQKTGSAARDISTSEGNLVPFEKAVLSLPEAEQWQLAKYIDGSPSGVTPPTPQLRAFADIFKGEMQKYRAQLEAMPEHAQMGFFEEFFPHMWKDPNAAMNAVREGRMGGLPKQGSAASTKKRSALTMTIDEGEAMGLEPVTRNPVEVGIRYINSIRKYIASQEILRAGKDEGRILFVRPKSMGASGHPDPSRVPPGYVPLEGRGATNQFGGRAYAPEDWARIYNNFISRGFDQVGGGEYGQAYNAARRASNAITQSVLSFSGYHAFTMAEASISNQMAKVMMELRHGKLGGAAKEAFKIPLAPIRYAIQGKKFKDIYLNKAMPVSPQDKEIIDLITEAGGRMGGSKHALDYESSALGDYLSSFRRGKLRAEILAQGKDIAGAPVMGTVRTVASNIGRIMDTFNKPLFQHYIPAMKNAAVHENMAQFLKLNPNATQAEKLVAARKVVDTVDDRFGEMIHDNIFWHKTAKQTAMLAALSYSWNMGGVRAIGGGVRDIARTAVGRGEWTPKADYVVGMTINWAIMSAAYQYMKTGEGPKDVRDLAAPRTGGIDERSGEPERIIPPGIMKDVFGYYEHFGQEIMNKMNPGMRIATQSLSVLGGAGGSDWRGDPILSPKEEGQSTLEKAPDWLTEYFNFVIKGMSPIQSQQLGRGPEQGSALNPLELGLGIRRAPRQFIDPEGQSAMMDRMWWSRWNRKQRHDEAEKSRYGGPSE